ncbi:MAG: hypothetical protein JNJ58_03085 [Chitinophagaceae bacterium]|nr:hypothetical protein [Chitinophagaceae bacterium]
MVRKFFILNVLNILSLQAYNQKNIHIANTNETKESVLFHVSNVDLTTIQHDTIAYYSSGKRKSVLNTLLPDDIKLDFLLFIKDHFVQSPKGLPIIMKITHLKVHAFQPNKLSAEDTLIFDCSFYSHWEGKKEHLFDFHARNSFGSSDARLLFFEQYLSRMISSAVSTFNKAFKNNTDWQSINQKEVSPIRRIIQHNLFEKGDSIACDKGFQLKKEYFTTKKNDSSFMDRMCRFVFTYQVLYEESKNGIDLNIHTFSFFDRRRSYLNPDVDHDNWIRYQQGHADLCSIFGMRLKSQLNDYPLTIGNFRTEINQIYNSLFDEYVRLRKQYQDETAEGTNPGILQQWRIQIDHWLNEL